MKDLDDALRRAGRNDLLGDATVRRELTAIAEARPHSPKRRGFRVVLPAVIAAGGILLGGAGAFAASVFGPWNIVTDPDYVIAREWHDVDGGYLGECESRVRIEHDSPEALAVAQQSLGSLDLDAIQPDPTTVALLLASSGRLDDYSRLIDEALPDPSIADLAPVELQGGLDYVAHPSDARILSIALIQAVHNTISGDLQEAGLDPAFEFTGEGEIQCSTDPER